MNENERRQESVQQQKAKIRRRYQGIDSEKIHVIPVTVSQPDFDDDSAPKRVAVYARVSTGDPRQTSSYELQKNYYESQVQKHSNWTLVSIYADEGLSGTSTQNRKEFNRMIEDCKAGKIDLILSKSISRFARNYVDCGQIVRELMELNPPVGVRFESENLFTLKMQGEMQLMMFSGIAQEESRIKSNAMNASIEMRFGSGIFLTPPLLGYSQDEDGNLIINEKEAKIVRLIFFLYLYGYTCQQIADTLTQLGCLTKKGNAVWSAGSVLGVLRNERHCGAVRARKTFTPNYLNHKSRKNRGDRLSYFAEEHHEPIIAPEDYFAVQKLLSNAKYGGRGILPELHAVADGALRGFVAVNPRWAGFEAADYREASLRVCESSVALEPVKIEAHPGDFDLREFEVVRAQFFQTVSMPCVTLSAKGIHFNHVCVQKLNKAKLVEVLVHPGKKAVAVRPAEEKLRHGLCWVRLAGNSRWISRTVSGAAFIPTLYQLFGWNAEYKYCVKGICCRNSEESILLFHWEDAEILIPDSVIGDTGRWFYLSSIFGTITKFCSRNIKNWREIMVRDAEKTIGNLIDKQRVSYIASISEDGFPNMKAMLPPRKRVGICEFYFTTNTSSMRVAQYRKNPNASIYFCDKRFFRGVMLVGHMEVLEDPASKEMIWQEGDTMYYPKGVTDPDYCVLKFVAQSGRYYANFHSETFEISQGETN